MAESRSKEFKKPFIMVAILLLVIAIFIANRWRTNKNISELDEQAKSEVNNRYAGQIIDQEVLQDQKFKDLKPIPKFQLDDFGPDISATELKLVLRRFSNPFKPF